MSRKLLTILGFVMIYGIVHGQSSINIVERQTGTVAIWNGRCGIIVPQSKKMSMKDKFFSPIQSFILADRRETDSTPNFLLATQVPISANSEIRQFNDSVVVVFNYLFPEKRFYKCSIIVRKNSPSICIEEDSNEDLSYVVRISSSGYFDQARYRGSNSTDPIMGYSSPGQIYLSENQRPPSDATVDLPANKELRYPLLSNWDPSGGEINTGRYWQIYRKNGSKNDNLFGVFQGNPSRLIGNKFVGVRFIAGFNPEGAGSVALEMSIVKRGPDNSFFPRKRFQWNAYISTKNNLLPPDKFQPIGIELNKWSGVGGLVELYAKKPLKLNRSFRNGNLYVDENTIQSMISRVKTDGAYYNHIVSILPEFKPILDTWRFPDSAISMKRTVINNYLQIKDILINGDGIHTFYYKYWMGSINYKRGAMQILALFADKTILLSKEETSQMEEFLRLAARVQWDNNYVPFFDSSGINYGTENMMYQYRNNGRNFFALIFSEDPEFSERAKEAYLQTRNDLQATIRPNGISAASPHYTQAVTDPMLFNMLQLKRAGVGDLFKEEKERLLAFVNFYSALLTPPSVRFMGFRKLVSIGDGSEESAPTFALLAAGFKDVYPELSDNLYHLFEKGNRRSSLFGELGLAIDMSDHNGKLNTSSANFSGYLSYTRVGLHSPLESALWIVNGDIYNDHRNDDRGEVIIYALGAPLSPGRSSFYSPRVSDARMRSVVIPESLFPSWKNGDQPINGEDKMGNPWKTASVKSFTKNPFLTTSVSVMTNNQFTWTRTLTTIHLSQNEPIILIRDDFNKPESMVWSMPFMSSKIKENNQDIAPVKAAVYNETKKELPSANLEKKLTKGWNSFQVTGQKWSKHPNQGIDCELYTYNPMPTSFTVSQWTNNWQNDHEKREFQSFNGIPYEETQQLLRISSAKPFFVILAPHPKGAKKLTPKIGTPDNASISLESAGHKYVLTPEHAVITDGTKSILCFLTENQVTVDNITVKGGGTTIVVDKNSIEVFVGRSQIKRSITFPYPVFPRNKADKYADISADGKTIEIQSGTDLNVMPDNDGDKIFRLTRVKS